MRAIAIAAGGTAIAAVALWVGAKQLGPPPPGEDPIARAGAQADTRPSPSTPTSVADPAPAPAPSPRPPSADPLLRSFELEKRGDLDGAAAAAQAAIVQADRRDARLQAAKIAILRDRLDEAEAWLGPLAVADPRDVPVRYNLALIEHRRGRAEAAREGYRAVLELAPDHADARYNLALLLRDMGDRPGARAEVQRLGELHPDDPRTGPLRQALGAPP